MESIDAFLWFTIFSYVFCAFFPKPVTKNIPWGLEKFFMALSGIILFLNLHVFNNGGAWLFMGMFWTAAAGLTYFGWNKWNILYKTEPSDAAQMVMFVWDALIAVSCFLKA